MPTPDSDVASKLAKPKLIDLNRISLDARAASIPLIAEQAAATEEDGILRATPSADSRDFKVRYRRLFDAAHHGILILNIKTGTITDVNPYLAELLGYCHAELIGKAVWEIGLLKDTDESKRVFQKLISKRFVRYENLPLKSKGGLTISVEVVSNVYCESGHEVIECNIRDIRSRKNAEQSEHRLRQAQKMEAIGQLAGGLAHDFNNLLGVIMGYCEILEEEPELSEPILRMISEIHNAGSSAKNLTQRLLVFSRRKVLQPVALDLNETVRRIERMLGRLIGEDIKIASVLCGDLGTIKADPNQVEQVLMNLAINSRDAMPGGGQIAIETANVEIDETFGLQYPSIEPGRYVRLTVSDTGTGMDLETQSHIFEPFFSTKPPGQGTGLGLSTVFGIVQQSGGAMAVYSEPGEGTTFKIYFPRFDEAPVAMQTRKAKPLRGGRETILLVDDADALRVLTRRLLEDSGYTVLESAEPAGALHIAQEYEGPLPLMITDVVMPGFSGRVLAERVTAARPDTKVLFMSGYNDSSSIQPDGCEKDCMSCVRHCAFLEKPFTRNELLKRVRDLLDTAT